MKCYNKILCYMHTETTDTGCKILSIDMPLLCEARKAFNRIEKAKKLTDYRVRDLTNVGIQWDKEHKK